MQVIVAPCCLLFARKNGEHAAFRVIVAYFGKCTCSFSIDELNAIANRKTKHTNGVFGFFLGKRNGFAGKIGLVEEMHDTKIA